MKIVCAFDILEDRVSLTDHFEQDFADDCDLSSGEIRLIVDAVCAFIESRDLKASYFVFDMTQDKRALSTPHEHTDFEEARRAAEEYHKRQAAVSKKGQHTVIGVGATVWGRKE